MAKLTVEELEQRVIHRETISAIRKRITQLGNMYGLEKAFEEAGCTCHPMRQQRDELDERVRQYLSEAFRERIVQQLSDPESPESKQLSAYASPSNAFSLNTTYIGPTNYILRDLLKDNLDYQEFQRLVKEVSEVDQREHPALDRAAKVARSFISVWVMQGGIERASLSDHDLMYAYAHAWVHEGWRPPAPQSKS